MDQPTPALDSQTGSDQRFPYQADLSLIDDIDLVAVTPGQDLNWLEDVLLTSADGCPAVFDRYSNQYLKIYFDIPVGRVDEIARKVLIKHLRAGNSEGVSLKHHHGKVPQSELGPWLPDSGRVGS